MNRGLWMIAWAMLIGGANCARETVTCPEGTAIVDFENGGRECVPVGPDGGLGGTGGMGKPECEDDLDCAFEEASRCDLTSQTCEPCLEDVDCAGIDGLPRCDAAEGLCVQCAPATEAMDCGEQSCDPATRECSDIVRGSRAECEACVSDSDCMEEFACVPMQFGNVPLRGGFCLRTTGSGQCTQPFAFPLPDARESLSGAAPAALLRSERSSDELRRCVGASQQRAVRRRFRLRRARRDLSSGRGAGAEVHIRVHRVRSMLASGRR